MVNSSRKLELIEVFLNVNTNKISGHEVFLKLKNKIKEKLCSI
jgi:hypothetical protein